MAKQKKLSRKKKKQLKKQLISKAASTQKITQKQAEKLSFFDLQTEVKKIEKAEAQQARRNAKRERASAAGIPDEIISKNRLAYKSEKALNEFISNFIKEKEKEQAKAKAEEQRKRKRELAALRKQDVLLILQGKGYSLDEARKIYNSGVKSFKKAEAYPPKIVDKNKVYTTKDYIAVLWYDPAGESNLGSALEQVKTWSRSTKRNKAKSIDRNAVYKKTTYEKFMGDYALKFGDKSDIEYWFNSKLTRSKNRGKSYQIERYKQIWAPRNTFTLKGIEDMMAAMLSALIPERQVDFMRDMAAFIKENIPEIYDTFF